MAELVKNCGRRILFSLIAIVCLFFLTSNLIAEGAETYQPTKVIKAVKNDVSPPLKDIKPIPPKPGNPGEVMEIFLGRPPWADDPVLPGGGSPGLDPVLQQGPLSPEGALMPAPIVNFDGLDYSANPFSLSPPDTDGDVGPNHYMQTVNIAYQIFDKTGTSLYGPAANNTMWSGFGGICESNNNGDPIVLYDHLADRWFFSQFALGSDFHQCIACSKTGDPLGEWYRYDFKISDTKMNDYPKFGVWPDGYYMSINQFTSGFVGPGIMVFERDKILQGAPSNAVYWDITDITQFSYLPANLDGPPPPAGTPNYFARLESLFFGHPADALQIYECRVDWTNPANSTFTNVATLPTAAFDPDMCGGSRDCIPQAGAAQTVDAISDRLMYLLQYRDFGAYQTMVANHTVDINNSDQAGVRWYELRDSGSGWTINQQGTYAGDAPNSDHRWMGSIAMDGLENIALGYSLSGSATFPSVGYVGRLSADPVGTLPQVETIMVAGGGAQTSSNRWGDYSAMSIDSVDDCTFWYTQEYYRAGDSGVDWSTRVGSFQFPSCTPAVPGVLQGTVTDGAGPIENVKVTAGGYTAFTDASGFYQFPHLPAGAYNMTAVWYGYEPGAASGVTVTSGMTTVQDFVLPLSASATVSGSVTDAATGWPLYASILIEAEGFSQMIYSDGATGAYSVSLPEDWAHTFTVSSIISGYTPEMRAVTPVAGGLTEDFALARTCNAPGTVVTDILPVEEFSSCGATPPAGWQLIDNIGAGDQWTFDDPGGRGNLTGGSGCFAIADSDYAGLVNMDTELWTPSLDCTAYGNVSLEFKYDYYNLGDTADVDVSADGGSTWTNVWRRTVSDGGPKTALVDISTQAAGQANVMVRFRYYDANYDYWWQVDDVRVFSCGAPASGGLVVGHVYDDISGAGINGATVDAGGGNTTTSFSAEDDGCYGLYAPTAGVAAITAAANSHCPDSQDVTVVDLDAVEQDFHLGDATLSVDPNSLEVYVQTDGTTSRLVSVSNMPGGCDVDFEIVEMTLRTSTLLPAASYPPDSEPYLDETEMHLPRQKKEDGPKKNALKDAQKQLPLPLTWGSGAAIPTGARYRAAGVTCDCGSYYIFGGHYPGATVFNEALKYEPSTNSWTSLANMPAALMGMEAACIDGYIYLVGGYTGEADTNNFLIYDTNADSWTATTWPNTRTPMTAVWEGKLYAFGGYPSYNETWMYDPVTAGWTGPLASMPTASNYGAAITAGDYIFVIGGVFSNTVQRYDPAADTWDATGPQLQDARMSALTVLYGDLIYVVSGGDEWTAWSTTEVYDPGLWPGGSWAYDDESIATPAVAMAGDCADGKIWGAGGADGAVDYNLNQSLDDGLSCNCPDPIPWLRESPTAGAIPVGGIASSVFTFDATGYGVGVYNGLVRVGADQATVSRFMPVTMHVVPSSKLTVKIPRTPDAQSEYFTGIQRAYNMAETGDEIRCRDRNYAETLTMNRNISVNVLAGCDAGFAPQVGMETSTTSMAVSDGTVTLPSDGIFALY